MSEGQRSRGYQRASELDCRLIRATKHGLKKDPTKTLLDKQNGKCLNVAVDSNIQYVFEISRGRRILRILVLECNITFWNRKNFKTSDLKSHIVIR
jgi:hypothetical protein